MAKKKSGRQLKREQAEKEARNYTEQELKARKLLLTSIMLFDAFDQSLSFLENNVKQTFKQRTKRMSRDSRELRVQMMKVGLLTDDEFENVSEMFNDKIFEFIEDIKIVNPEVQ